MNKLILPSFFFAAACACSPHVYSDIYSIKVKFSPYDVKKLVEVDEYCMDSDNTPSVVTIHETTSFDVETNGYVFSKCGYVHSSVTYDVENSHGKSMGQLEFYKPVDGSPHLDFDSATLKCQTSELNLICNPAD